MHIYIKSRDIKLEDHGISWMKYRELKYFCMQYEQKKKEVIKTKDKKLSERLIKEMELIEQTAIKADDRIYSYIIKNATQGIAYEYMDVPIGRTNFYNARRKFFTLLAAER